MRRSVAQSSSSNSAHPLLVTQFHRADETVATPFVPLFCPSLSVYLLAVSLGQGTTLSLCSLKQILLLGSGEHLEQILLRYSSLLYRIGLFKIVCPSRPLHQALNCGPRASQHSYLRFVLYIIRFLYILSIWRQLRTLNLQVF